MYAAAGSYCKPITIIPARIAKFNDQTAKLIAYFILLFPFSLFALLIYYNTSWTCCQPNINRTMVKTKLTTAHPIANLNAPCIISSGFITYSSKRRKLGSYNPGCLRFPNTQCLTSYSCEHGAFRRCHRSGLFQQWHSAPLDCLGCQCLH